MDKASPPSERRQSDRRRRARGARPDESWFRAFIRDADAVAHDGIGSASANVIEGPEPQLRSRDGESGAAAGPSTFHRIYRAFLSARAALGLALVLTVAVAGFFGASPGHRVAIGSVVYALLAVAMWLTASGGSADQPGAAGLGRVQWLACIGVDIVSFMVLHALSPANNLNYVALLVLPVLMAGVLTPRIQALATAAGAGASAFTGAAGVAAATPPSRRAMTVPLRTLSPAFTSTSLTLPPRWTARPSWPSRFPAWPACHPCSAASHRPGVRSPRQSH